jgi:CheY-like chemotaxis protein
MMARILIVEPHADVRSLLEHVVARLGHEPVFPDGDGGDLEVEVGLIEPGDTEGLRLARKLRERGRPVVFASIFPPEDEMLELAPVAYFMKPFALRELQEALVTAVDEAEVLASPRRSLRAGA